MEQLVFMQIADAVEQALENGDHHMQLLDPGWKPLSDDL